MIGPYWGFCHSCNIKRENSFLNATSWSNSAPRRRCVWSGPVILNTVGLAAVALRNLLSESLINRKNNLSDFIFRFYSCFYSLPRKMVWEIEFLLLPILQILVRCMHLNQNNTSTSPFQALKNRLLRSIQLCRYGAGGASSVSWYLIWRRAS